MTERAERVVVLSLVVVQVVVSCFRFGHQNKRNATKEKYTE